ncbi:response regulator [Ottowia sp.]|uniref:response regulator n=1 Tax=Ottowia sp. TaxID=1898956 RepID=UPI002BA3CE90|nr:response regulator [Ottowia sp.]HOB65153.1 response regulator [Ottowia sp.]HPZ58538.1 response regulator [Ottowia sp.]HQD46622.1 response regulator [Ottowia sp.]
MAQDTVAPGAGAPPADEVRVVVVDDHLDAADMMAAALELEGYQAQVATSGEQALALIETFRPHVVLLDVNMPGMDGRELTRRLRAQYEDEMVLIAVSGSDPHDERVSETFDAVDHYFRKPIDLAALRRLLRP